MTAMLEQLIDKSLDIWVSNRVNCLPVIPPDDMAMNEKAEDDDWYFWKPIFSKVTNQEIAELEKYTQISFPEQYKRILKHKHFLELCIGEARLTPHPSFGWQNCITDMIFSYPKELFSDLGYFPFATYSDWGLWCFKLDEKSAENEYPVYLWDHERSEQFEFVAQDLERALIQEIKAF